MADIHQNFMQEALKLAEENVHSGNGGPFGAIIVKNGEIISRASNHVLKLNDPTAHAEVMAIRAACEKLGTYFLDDCEIYTSCEPCPMCLGAIYWAHIRKIWYCAGRKDAASAGFDDSFIYDQIGTPIEKRSIPAEQLLKEVAGKAFKTWMDFEEKKPY
jgi:tRNA(Arg) A34 adenosine deaminase TadA